MSNVPNDAQAPPAGSIPGAATDATPGTVRR